jgi:hypothetical protein
MRGKLGLIAAALALIASLLAPVSPAQADATFYGSAGDINLNQPIVGMAATPSGHGYWIVARDGGVFTYGDALYYGGHGGTPLNAPIIGIASTPSGHGYWLAASDGGVFSYGDANFYGSAGNINLNQPIVGVASSASGHGYWLVASDGGIFGYGDALYYGGHGGSPLNKPIVGIAATASGHGYWLVGTDGGIFTYGDAPYYGGHGGSSLNRPIVGMAATTSGNGYWLVASDGGIFSYGSATFYGSTGGIQLNRPIVGMASTSNGYWLVASDGGIFVPNAQTTFGMWRPSVGTKWQWQLSGSVDQSVNVPVYDIDLFDNSSSVVTSLHAQGRHVICYVDVGTYENWRSDAGSFPAGVLGNSNGWPGEKWLDVRQISTLQPIMAARFDQCKAKGFDAVEPDNIDGYSNSTGFSISASNQLTYNRMIAGLAHARGMSIALKNDVDQIDSLEPDFDFAVNEQCFEYSECDGYSRFINNSKAVLEVEYNLNTSDFCSQANAMGISAMKKDLNLTATRQAC